MVVATAPERIGPSGPIFCARAPRGQIIVSDGSLKGCKTQSRRPTTERYAPHMLERQVELGQLSRMIARARGGAGGVAVVVGPAGIGKTRLLDAARELACE